MGFVVNDSMILIHLAKISVLEQSCKYFGKAIIPPKVFDEVVKKGKEKGFVDAIIIDNLIKKKKINIVKITDKKLLNKANNFNVFGGEAEAVALYWQKRAKLIATDDDNVRKKKEILEINLIGSPSIILSLYIGKKINKEKAIEAINKLRKIGWFSNEVLDKILMGVEK